MERASADASGDPRARAYWREEFTLVALLLAFFTGVLVLASGTPFDARLFPMVIGGAGLLLAAAVGLEQWRLRRSHASHIGMDDPAARASRGRRLAALLCAPGFGLLFWLVGFVVASLTAMLVLPVLMGYRDLRRLVVIAVISVGLLAVVAPHLLNVDLPHGVVGEWLTDRLALRAD